MDHHLDGIEADPKERVRLDHLEALVHERRGVNGDLRAHAPGRVRQRILHADVSQLVRRGGAERTTGGRQEDPPHRRSATTHHAQTLVDRAVLGIDRDDLGSRGRPDLLDEWRRRDQRLLVGKRQPPPSTKCPKRGWETREAQHCVDGHVGIASRRLETRRTDAHERPVDAGADELMGGQFVSDDHLGGLIALDLIDEQSASPPRSERLDSKAFWMTIDHIERLSSD